MKRRIALLLLLCPLSGCAIIEDMFVGDMPPAYQAQMAAQPTAGSCGMPNVNVSASQTAEPELLQMRK